MKKYPEEMLDSDWDDGTMPNNVAEFEQAIVGCRIVSVEKGVTKHRYYEDSTEPATVITLNSGVKVALVDTDDCCAFTELEEFLLHPERVDHIITGVGTTDGYTTWHVYADLGDILELKVNWSAGNIGYYGYGFDIRVEPASEYVITELV